MRGQRQRLGVARPGCVEHLHLRCGERRSFGHINYDPRAAPVGDVCGLASDQCAARLTASFGDPFDNLLRLWHGKFARSEVIQKEERFRSGHRNVIHAHRDQVDADRVVLIHHECDFELCPDSIGREGEGSITEIKQPGKVPDRAHHLPRSLPPVGQVFNQGFDRGSLEVDVDSCGSVRTLCFTHYFPPITGIRHGAPARHGGHRSGSPRN